MEVKTPFKELSFKQKLQYIYDYYKFHIIITLVILGCSYSLIHHLVTYREPDLNIIMINSYFDNGDTRQTTEYFEDTLDQLIDNGRVALNTSINLNTSSMEGDAMTALTSLDMLAAAGAEDLYFVTEDTFEFLAQRNYFPDLSEIFTDEELEELGDAIYTITQEDGQHQVGIRISNDNAFLKTCNNYPHGDCVVGVSYNRNHIDVTKSFLLKLLSNN